MSARDGNIEIHVIGSDGSAPTRLTSNIVNDGHPAWSPDGERIAFVSEQDGDREIYVMDADGTGPTNLTNDPRSDSWWPAW